METVIWWLWQAKYARWNFTFERQNFILSHFVIRGWCQNTSCQVLNDAWSAIIWTVQSCRFSFTVSRGHASVKSGFGVVAARWLYRFFQPSDRTMTVEADALPWFRLANVGRRGLIPHVAAYWLRKDVYDTIDVWRIESFERFLLVPVALKDVHRLESVEGCYGSYEALWIDAEQIRAMHFRIRVLLRRWVLWRSLAVRQGAIDHRLISPDNLAGTTDVYRQIAAGIVVGHCIPRTSSLRRGIAKKTKNNRL